MVVVAGRDMVDDRRREVYGSTAEGGAAESGLKRELADDWADGRVSDSFFMFLGRGLARAGKMKESVSEAVEERVEHDVGLSEKTRVWERFAGGVSMRRGVRGPRLRGGAEARRVDCGRGVAVSMF